MSEIRFSAEPLESLKQSIDKIFEIAKKYKSDVSEEIATMSIFDFYIFLRDGLAYRKDPSGVEMIALP